MGKTNITFQRLRRERRMNFSDVSDKSGIPVSRIKELDESANFSNSELAKICDSLDISMETFFAENEMTQDEPQYVLKLKIDGDLANSDLFDAISYTEENRMNNNFDTKFEGWRHNSFNEAFIVLENARNYLGSVGFSIPSLYREGNLAGCLNYDQDNAFIEGINGQTVHYGFDRSEREFDIDELPSMYDDFRDLEDELDDYLSDKF